MKDHNRDNFCHRIQAGALYHIALLSAGLSTLLFMGGPLHLLHTSFGLWSTNIIWYGSTASVVLTAILTLIGSVPSIRPIVLNLIKALIVFYFAMIVFFPHKGGLLDGRDASGESWATLAGTMALLLGSVVLAFHARELAGRLVVLIVVLSVAFCVYAWSSFRPPPGFAVESELVAVRNRFEEVGTNENVFVFLIDMLQGSILENAIGRDAIVAARFDGFELFSRAISAFPMTGYSLPNLLSGKLYNESFRSQGEVLRASLYDSFIVDARKRGYEISTMSYAESLPLSDRANESMTASMYVARPNNRRGVLAYSHLLIASLTRNTKISDEIWKAVSRILLGSVPIEELNSLTSEKLNSREALQVWTHNLKKGQRKKLSLQHHVMAHAPVIFARDGSVKQNLPMTMTTVGDEYLYAMDSLAAALGRLKDLDVYDKSLIIITGDHGHFLSSNPEWHAGTDFAAGALGANWRYAGMYNPAILVKRPHAKGGLRIRLAPLALADIRGIITRYLDSPADMSGTALDMTDAENRENVVFVARKDSARNFWFSAGHEKLIFRGNVTSLPVAFEQMRQKP